MAYFVIKKPHWSVPCLCTLSKLGVEAFFSNQPLDESVFEFD